ncbi:carboxylesterase [Xylariaceae sp. FL0804]|nr:carboxylesterase [Xylariaceae sp. FL0804]
MCSRQMTFWLLAAAAAVGRQPPTSTPEYTVGTTNGEITGHQAPNCSDLIEFLGIPFAQPPTGSLRFEAPVKYAGHGHQIASRWVGGSICPQGVSSPSAFPGKTPQAQQIINYFQANVGLPQSEDCLTLNIWSKGLGPLHGKPVLVFFYGGRTATGSSHSPFYNGQYWASAEDVVIVTLNYRVNIFGFPGAPGATKNLGFRDQRLAVEWVRDNVLQFGGDPARITLFGQSAGAVAVDYWSYAYVEDPIVSGFISHSGNALSFPMNNESTTLSNWYNVSETVGCGSSGDTLPCMKTKDFADIEEAAVKAPSLSSGSPLRSVPPFYPQVDDEIVFANYTRLSEEGKFARLPYVFGNNQHEQGYYIIPAEANGVNVTEAEGDFFLLASFTCPNAFGGLVRHQHGVPVWVFRNFGRWPNLRLYPGSGAYHGSDVDVLFGNDGVVSGIPPSRKEEEFTILLQHAWAEFARDPTEGLARLGWPRYSGHGETLVQLAYNDQPKAEFVEPRLYDAPCSTVPLAAYATS